MDLEGEGAVRVALLRQCLHLMQSLRGTARCESALSSW